LAGLGSIATVIGGTTSSMMSLVSSRAGNILAGYLANISTRCLAGVPAKRLTNILTKYLVTFKYNKIKDYLFLFYSIKQSF
jgi:hypothetical protein